jgi:hypothetical protein
MKVCVHAALGVRCPAVLEDKLNRFDASALEYFRLYDRTGKTATAGIWGRCNYPNRRKRLGYRIRCSVSIDAREFPYRVRWAVGTRAIDKARWEWLWREEHLQTKEEAFVLVAGHEAFHWLRHSRQIPGANRETQANRYGCAWLDEWRALTDEAAMVDEQGRLRLRVQDDLRLGTVDTSKARLCYPDGRASYFDDQALAYLCRVAGPAQGVRAAFRGANDTTPIYPWDYADAL